jgi:hypothetical protein
MCAECARRLKTGFDSGTIDSFEQGKKMGNSLHVDCIAGGRIVVDIVDEAVPWHAS